MLHAHLRTQWYEAYLLSLLIAPARREAAQALLALAHELAQIPHKVSTPMLGLIRLQWWREAVLEIKAGQPPRQHALLEALTPHLSALPGPLLEAWFESHAEALDEAPPSDRRGATLNALVAAVQGVSSDAAREALGGLWGKIHVPEADISGASSILAAAKPAIRALPKPARGWYAGQAALVEAALKTQALRLTPWTLWKIYWAAIVA